MKEEYTNQHRRWYDKDPVLSQAVRTLEETDDETQIKIALNLIKIIIEHNIEDEKFEAVEDIINAVGSGLDDNRKGRWYDIDSTLRTAMSMLQNCPSTTQHIIAKEMAKMVVDSIKKKKKLKTIRRNSNWILYDRKIRLLYDAAYICNILDKNSHRSGIFFVAYNVLLELLKHDEFDVWLYAAGDEARLKEVINKYKEFAGCKIYKSTFWKNRLTSGVI